MQFNCWEKFSNYRNPNVLSAIGLFSQEITSKGILLDFVLILINMIVSNVENVYEFIMLLINSCVY